MLFTFQPLDIPDLILVEPRIFSDSRGFFLETYQKSIFAENGIAVDFVQDNMSCSSRATLRGLHYQIEPHAQGKLVTCVKGDVFDVAVDIRRNSPTFGKWMGIRLTDENRHMLYIPPGFAHGFCVMSDVAHFVYKVTSEYAPAYERGIVWNDPVIAIDWPVKAPILSDRDRQLPTFEHADYNFVY